MIDLHTHSTASDGLDRPEDLVRKAVNQGVRVLSLTDHDTVAGLAYARQAADAHSLTFLSGIEITTDYQDTEVHLLGYCIDFTNSELVRACEEIHHQRRERAKEIIAKLYRFGYELTWESFAHAPADFIGRSHIMDKLVEEGLVAPHNRDEFFDTFLAKAGKAYVPHYYITPRRGIELINIASGVAVLAHPGRMIGEWSLSNLVGYGLSGLEVWYPTHSRSQTAEYLRLTKRYGLIPTGGTDYHGRGERPMGMPRVAPKTPELLIQAAKGGVK